VSDETSNMSPESHADDLEDFSAEELLEQAQINAQALFLGTAKALANNEVALDSWRNQLAGTFIRGWDTEMEWEASDILYALLTSYRSYGAEVIDADLEADPPVALIDNLPNVFLAEMLEVEPDLMHHLFRIGEDLASQLGGALLWRTTDDGSVELKVSVE
jgi:hypothetical protein